MQVDARAAGKGHRHFTGTRRVSSSNQFWTRTSCGVVDELASTGRSIRKRWPSAVTSNHDCGAPLMKPTYPAASNKCSGVPTPLSPCAATQVVDGPFVGVSRIGIQRSPGGSLVKVHNTGELKNMPFVPEAMVVEPMKTTEERERRGRADGPTRRGAGDQHADRPVQVLTSVHSRRANLCAITPHAICR